MILAIRIKYIQKVSKGIRQEMDFFWCLFLMAQWLEVVTTQPKRMRKLMRRLVNPSVWGMDMASFPLQLPCRSC